MDNIPKVNSINGKLVMDGHFKFQLSPTLITEDTKRAYKNVSFSISVEVDQYVTEKHDESEIEEFISERLKQDFKLVMKQPLK